MNALQPLISVVGLIRSVSNRNGRRLPPFTGRNLFSTSKHNEHLAATNALLNQRIVRGGSDAIFIDDTGVTYQLKSDSASSSNQASGVLSFFYLTAVYGDYITAVPVVGPTLSTTIAKPAKLRESITAETKFGTVYSYAYSDTASDTTNPLGASNNRTRTSTNGDDSTTEAQLAIPIWIPQDGTYPSSGYSGDTIAAIAVIGGVPGVLDAGGAPVNYLMIEDSRHWAKIA